MENTEICVYMMYIYMTRWRGVEMISSCDVLFVAFDLG